MSVTIFCDQEDDYSKWLSDNYDYGYVFNFDENNNAIHRASCSFLRRKNDITNGTRTSRYHKHVSTDFDELLTHVKQLPRKKKWKLCPYCCSS